MYLFTNQIYLPKKKKTNQSIYQKKNNDFQKQLNNIKLKHATNKFGYFNLINKTIGLMSNQLSELTLKVYQLDVLINISRKTCGIFDFYKAEELVEIGKHLAMKNIEMYKNKSL